MRIGRVGRLKFEVSASLSPRVAGHEERLTSEERLACAKIEQKQKTCSCSQVRLPSLLEIKML